MLWYEVRKLLHKTNKDIILFLPYFELFRIHNSTPNKNKGNNLMYLQDAAPLTRREIKRNTKKATAFIHLSCIQTQPTMSGGCLAQFYIS